MSLHTYRNPAIESGLDRLLAKRQPGQVFSEIEIARECGVSHQSIRLVTIRAMHKLRQKLIEIEATTGLNFLEEFRQEETPDWFSNAATPRRKT